MLNTFMRNQIGKKRTLGTKKVKNIREGPKWLKVFFRDEDDKIYWRFSFSGLLIPIICSSSILVISG